jgi:hypothetical protein
VQDSRLASYMVPLSSVPHKPSLSFSFYLSIYPIGSASSFHSSVSSAPCNVDNSSGRSSLASDTIAVPTYGQALITSTAEQNSASKAERAGRAGLPLVVAALARGSGFNIVLWPGEGLGEQAKGGARKWGDLLVTVTSALQLLACCRIFGV